MARYRRSSSVEQPRAFLHVAAVAIALLGYMLLPVVHSAHHAIEERAAQAGLVDSAHHTCNHAGCRPASTSDDADPSENPHDPSSCEVCQVLFAARKNITPPPPGVTLVAPPTYFEVIAAQPGECITIEVVLPRSSRGPPVLA